MSKFVAAALVLAFAAPALAQSAAPAEKVAYVCWYNAAGKFTSATKATSVEGPRTFTTTGRGGDQAWAIGIKSVDGADCPKQVRY
jgi:hypothetical protein